MIAGPDVDLLEHVVAAVVLLDARPRGSAGSFTLPKTIASDGQAWAQAVVNSPSRIGRSSSRAWFCAPRMRWTQKVHFSITPRARTVTSGLSWRWSGSGQAISLYLTS